MHETQTSKTGLNERRLQVLSALLSLSLKHAWQVDTEVWTGRRGDICRALYGSRSVFDCLLHLGGMLLTLNLSKQISLEMIYYL